MIFNLAEQVQKAKKTLFSLEVIPPLKGENVKDFFESIDPLIEFNPAFINVTYHREEYVYNKKENGLLEKISVRKRPGTVGICAAITTKYGIPAVPHLICGGFTKEETENALIDLNFLGISNVLALRGDPIKSEKIFQAEEKGHKYAVNLVEQVSNMNKGIFLNETVSPQSSSNFCIGIAGYPEKHFESPNMELDLFFLKEKIDAGAEFIVTQMFYENEKYFRFVEKCQKAGINIPIIPGLKPLTGKKQLTNLPKLFHIDIPQKMVQSVLDASSSEDVKKIGVDWCIKQSLELKENNVPCLHYYTMNKSEGVKKVAKEVFKN